MDTDGRPEQRQRPSRNETFAAATELVSGGSAGFRRFARRYSLCAADADDAYQRGLEILLTKAPTTDRSELRAWLHTVIKHEALALRRQRERALAGTDPGHATHEPAEPALDEEASGRERVRQTAEALAHLKPAEIQCLLLKALGYSYREISARTGYSWTKVNRSLTEGRRRFLERFGELASGARCIEFEALLSVACDGESTTAENRRLRVHLKRCGSCRAALRGYRSAPARLAELLPPGVLLPVFQQGGWWSRLGDWMAAHGGDRAGAVAWKVQQGAEALSAQKAAVVVASTAALAGGTAVHEEKQQHRARHSGHLASEIANQTPERASAVTTPVVDNSPTARPAPPPSGEQQAPRDAADATPAGEFTPEAGVPATASSPAPMVAATAAPTGARPVAHTAAAGGAEFGP